MLNNVKAKAAIKAKAKAAESVALAAESTITTESAPATETQPAAPSAADKRAAYIADATAAKAIFRSLDAAISIPIKPGAFKAKPLNPKAYSLSERGAAAIYCAVAASGKSLSDGETYNRRFLIGTIPYTIENGAFSDFIGTAYTVDSTTGLGNESFTLLPGSSAAIRAKLGNKIAAFKL